MIKQIPQLYDGAYWYTIEAEFSDETWTAPDLFNGWAGVYKTIEETKYMLIRTLSFVNIPLCNKTVKSILGDTAKFFARMEGR